MRTAKCADCGSQGALNSYFYVNNNLLCEPCADKRVQEAAGSAIQPEVRRGQDPSVCSKCQGDAGSGEFEIVSGAPFCPACKEAILNHPFPQWLKLGLAFSLILLVAALVYGQKYFRAGKSLYRAERLVKERQYEAAASQLREALNVTPNCEKCILLLAKADLLAGEPAEAYKVVTAHNGGNFEKSALGSEVSSLFERVDSAMTLLEKAQGEIKEHKSEEALATIDQMQRTYPEMKGVQQLRNVVQIDIAFLAKDYDRFAAIAEEDHKAVPQSSYYTALLASAVACQYAVNGEPTLKLRAESLLSEAESQIKSDAERTDFNEYSERIQHRLKTREVIDKEEYDRRFRPASQEKKEQ